MIFSLMVMIETLLAMTFVLSRRGGLKSFARGMLRYDQNQVDQAIDDVCQGKVGYPVFGLPKTGTISVAKHDQRFLHELFTDMAKNYCRVLMQFAQFYDNHRSAYGKLKHGLMFNFTELNDASGTSTKILVTFDRNEKTSMRGQYYRPSENPSPPGLDWFNVSCLIPLENTTYQMYSQLADSICRLAQGIIDNYLRYVTNCGQNYLPAGVEEMFSAESESQRLRRYEDIKRRLEPSMYLVSMTLNIEQIYREQAARRISADFAERHVSVHWYPTNDTVEERKYGVLRRIRKLFGL